MEIPICLAIFIDYLSHNYLTEPKDIIGNNISQLIKKEGYTKASFAKITGISRPTLNKILDGDIPSSTTLETHINKIMQVLNINIEALLENNSAQDKQDVSNPLYSDNSPQNYERSESTNKKLHLLDSILDLCEIYYK